MISIDSSVFIDFFRGTENKSTDALHKALEDKQLIMNPFVLSELLCSPKLPKKTEEYLIEIPRLEIISGFFERAGFLRRKIFMEGEGVSIADIYIAQTCIDAQVPLLTLDQDLFLISKHSDLELVQSV